MACAHLTSAIGQRHATTAFTHQSWCMSIDSTTLVMSCTHQLGNIVQWKRASYEACMHQTWRVRIYWETLVVAYMYWPGDVGQRHAASTKVLAHLTWFLHI
uniref:Uncharacterized protein n=1 Tax=Solanum lycopersicum TaxID=4081 RepID=A0A3Q7HC34_SOLLC